MGVESTKPWFYDGAELHPRAFLSLRERFCNWLLGRDQERRFYLDAVAYDALALARNQIEEANRWRLQARLCKGELTVSLLGNPGLTEFPARKMPNFICAIPAHFDAAWACVRGSGTAEDELLLRALFV